MSRENIVGIVLDNVVPMILLSGVDSAEGRALREQNSREDADLSAEKYIFSVIDDALKDGRSGSRPAHWSTILIDIIFSTMNALTMIAWNSLDRMGDFFCKDADFDSASVLAMCRMILTKLSDFLYLECNGHKGQVCWKVQQYTTSMYAILKIKSVREHSLDMVSDLREVLRSATMK